MPEHAHDTNVSFVSAQKIHDILMFCGGYTKFSPYCKVPLLYTATVRISIMFIFKRFTIGSGAVFSAC